MREAIEQEQSPVGKLVTGYRMLAFSWLGISFLLYLMPAAFFSLLALRWHFATWSRCEVAAQLIPFIIWSCLTAIDGSGKTLSNMMVEPFLCGCSTLAPILCSIRSSKTVPQRNHIYYAGWCIACILALLIYFFLPAIPE